MEIESYRNWDNGSMESLGTEKMGDWDIVILM